MLEMAVLRHDRRSSPPDTPSVALSRGQDPTESFEERPAARLGPYDGPFGVASRSRRPHARQERSGKRWRNPASSEDGCGKDARVRFSYELKRQRALNTNRRTAMKIIVSALVVLSVLATVAAPGNASDAKSFYGQQDRQAN